MLPAASNGFGLVKTTTNGLEPSASLTPPSAAQPTAAEASSSAAASSFATKPLQHTALLYEEDRAWTPESTTSTANAKASGSKTMPVDRQEVVRLMLQTLRDAGYNNAAESLETESGYTLASPPVTAFQEAILGGRWSEALALLSELGFTAHDATQQALFLVARQKYLELLETNQQKKALTVLRGELAPVAKEPEKLHELSGFMMCLDRDDLYERAQWDGAGGSSRRELLDELQHYATPAVMLPSRRMATLLDQARRHQQLQCLYHSEPESISLYTDHTCTDGLFPSVTTHVLADHTDEVWRIEWSLQGDYLASASKDRSVIIWQIKKVVTETGVTCFDCTPYTHLRDHKEAVEALAWSPDGQRLVSAAGSTVYLWNARNGFQLKTVSGKHLDTISAIQWLPDGSGFVAASKDSQLIFYDADGNSGPSWRLAPLQIEDFVIAPDSSRIFATALITRRTPVDGTLKPATSASTASPDGPVRVGSVAKDGSPTFAPMDRQLVVLNVSSRVVEAKTDFKNEMSSIKLSEDGTKLLLGCGPDEIQLWSYSKELSFIRRYKGHDQSRFLIRNCFGAARDKFILSGSEDCNVYVWQTHTGELLEVLAGHDDTVNGVAWSPIRSDRIFASCSDDGTIRIWQPPAAVAAAEALNKAGSKAPASVYVKMEM